MLTTEVSLNPKERTSVRALIDLTEEAMNLTHGEAVRWVLNVRRNARHEQLALRAKPLIEVHSAYYIDIREEARELLGLPLGAYLMLSIGRHAIRAKVIETELMDAWAEVNMAAYCVSLSPQWVLKLQEQIDFVAEMFKPVRRRTRRTVGPRRGGQHDPAGA